MVDNNKNLIAFIRPVEYNMCCKVRCIMGYLSASQAAKKWNISQRRVQVLCSENRIEGAFKVGEVWAIPDDAPKPLDFRVKSNKSNNKAE